MRKEKRKKKMAERRGEEKINDKWKKSQGKKRREKSGKRD